MRRLCNNGDANSRIAVAMSGGVDSSVAAALLAEAGHDVIGITALMSGEYSRCCSPEDAERARDVAGQLGIPHHLVDLHEAFDERIVRPFVAEYLAGRTPSPCVLCNRWIKFGRLMAEAEKLGAERLATGHYARIAAAGDGCAALLKARDKGKDQSYFLAMLGPDQLGRSLFPLGGMLKRDVTRIAAERGLSARHSKESQELCFVPEGSHGDWIDLRSFQTPGEGDIVDLDGRVLGRHPGIHHFTIGQRKGLGIAVGRPVYVVRLDALRNEVVVGDRARLMSGGMTVDGARWLRGDIPVSLFRAHARIRYTHHEVGSWVTPRADGVLHVEFDEAQFAVTPGQLAVFYDGDEVIGAGWIRDARPCPCDRVPSPVPSFDGAASPPRGEGREPGAAGSEPGKSG